MTQQHIAVGFPRDEHEREKLRQLGGGHPLPAIYPDSIDMKCDDCSLVLAVGPRVRAVVLFDKIPIVCPYCFAKRSRQHPPESIINLGNPDSKFENE